MAASDAERSRCSAERCHSSVCVCLSLTDLRHCNSFRSNALQIPSRAQLLRRQSSARRTCDGMLWARSDNGQRGSLVDRLACFRDQVSVSVWLSDAVATGLRVADTRRLVAVIGRANKRGVSH